MTSSENSKGKILLVLAMHGSPPTDFPKRETAEFFELHLKAENTPHLLNKLQKHRHDELGAKMRSWPRTPQNDRFYASSQEIAEHLSNTVGFDVIVGFNEFCDPSLDDALSKAASQSIEKCVVITPMMTQGGQHSEIDIPAAVKRAQERYPKISFVYVWPYEPVRVAQFLAAEINRFLENIGK